MSKMLLIMEIEVPESVPGFGDPKMAIHATIRDALAEFHDARSPAEKYLANRYPLPDYAWVNREEKLQSIKARIDISEKLLESLRTEVKEATYKAEWMCAICRTIPVEEDFDTCEKCRNRHQPI